jgi:hypothetical protein
MSPGGSGVELLPFDALMRRSAGGSGSSTAGIGTSSAVSSWISPSLSLNAFKNACYCDLKEGLFDILTGVGKIRFGRRWCVPYSDRFIFIIYTIPNGVGFIIQA